MSIASLLRVVPLSLLLLAAPLRAAELPLGGDEGQTLDLLAPDAAFAGYDVVRPVGGILRADPEATIEKEGSVLSAAELRKATATDGAALTTTGYLMLKVPATGPVQVTWTGYTTGIGEMLLSWWDGERFQSRYLVHATEATTQTLIVQPPKDADTVYLLINPTFGELHTDAITVAPAPADAVATLPGSVNLKP